MNKKYNIFPLLALTGLLLATVACTSSPASSSSTHSATSSSPTGGSAQTCAPGPTPKSINSIFGLAVGGAPVWAIGFENTHATLHSQGSTTTQYGWLNKILWEIGPNYSQAVTLHGWSSTHNLPLWFQFGDQAPTKTPVLDPHTTTISTGSDTGWAGFPSYLIVPAVDCYFLEAQWQGGSWRISFEASL